MALTGRDAARGEEVVAEIKKAGGKAIFIRADVSSAEECRRTVAETLKAFGRLDIFNNAGVFYAHTILECSEEEWDSTIDIGLKGILPDGEIFLADHDRPGWGCHHQQCLRVGVGWRRCGSSLLCSQRRRGQHDQGVGDRSRPARYSGQSASVRAMSTRRCCLTTRNAAA